VRRRLRLSLIVAPFLLGGGVVCLATGWSFATLALGRFVMGVAHSLVMIGGLTAVLHHHPVASLGAALSAFEFSAMLGMLGGVSLAGSLPTTLAWNHVYLVACSPQVLGMFVLPFLSASLPREAAAATRPSTATRPPGSRVHGAVTPPVILVFATGAMVSAAWSTLEQFTIPLRAAGEFGLERAGVAVLFMTMQLCDIAMLLPMGLIADRVPKARVLAVVVLMFGAGTFLVTFGDLTRIRLGCVVVGLGMAGWMLPLGVLRQETPPERIALRTALYRVAVDGGLFLGPFLSGFIGRAHLGILPSLTAAALVVIGLALLTTVREPRIAAVPDRSAVDS
jgi:predicted MFS family arabinose efflux permease